MVALSPGDRVKSTIGMAAFHLIALRMVRYGESEGSDHRLGNIGTDLMIKIMRTSDIPRNGRYGGHRSSSDEAPRTCAATRRSHYARGH